MRCDNLTPFDFEKIRTSRAIDETNVVSIGPIYRMKRDDPRDNLPLITLEEHSDQIKIDAGIFTGNVISNCYFRSRSLSWASSIRMQSWLNEYKGTTYLDKTDMLIAALLAVVLILSVFVVSLYLRWKKVTKRFKQPRTESLERVVTVTH